MRLAPLLLTAAALAACVPAAPAEEPAKLNQPPKGFTALFNGKDLTGWQSAITMAERKKLSKEQIAKKLKADNARVLPHWAVKDGVLHYDGKGFSLQTVKDYGNFELLLDWKIAAKGDSGIYLRGQPQVQVWDSDTTPGARGLDKHSGSGGLWNNPEGSKGKRPLKKADKPVGEWNTFRIVMKGDQVTVYLNGELVVDKEPLPNYWFRGEPLPKKGPVELQHHGDELWFRNIFIKELPD
jgi:hypothetical protein